MNYTVADRLLILVIGLPRNFFICYFFRSMPAVYELDALCYLDFVDVQDHCNFFQKFPLHLPVSTHFPPG